MGQHGISSTSLSKALADKYFDTLKKSTSPVRVSGLDGDLQGWTTSSLQKTLNIVCHPLWEFSPNGGDRFSDAVLTLADECGDVDQVRCLDTFNLTRRMSWVRANIDEYFAGIPIAANGASGEMGQEDNAEKFVGLPIGAGFSHEGKEGSVAKMMLACRSW